MTPPAGTFFPYIDQADDDDDDGGLPVSWARRSVQGRVVGGRSLSTDAFHEATPWVSSPA